MGLRDLFSAYRASRRLKGVDPEVLMQSFAGTAPDASGPFNAAAHMQHLAQAGLVAEAALEPGDARLEPIDGMSFVVYVKLAAGAITEPTDEAGLEARGRELGMAPETTTPAYELWGQKVVSDPELGMHYTAALQAEVAARQQR